MTKQTGIEVLSATRSNVGTMRDNWYFTYRTLTDAPNRVRHLNWNNRDFRFGFLLFCMGSDARN